MINSNNNLHLAPERYSIVDGLKAVPIDIQYLDAKLVFDIESKRAYVEASMDFVVLERGNPIFDLRQDIGEALLNESPLDTSRLKHHDFGGGENAEMFIIEEIVLPDKKNNLKLAYELNQPRCPRSKPIGWSNTRLYFDFWFSDLNAARYLEMWFPSNLIYDQFSFNLEIEIINTDIEHRLVANGKIKDISINHWQILFPKRFTSMSHMLLILPADRIDYLQSTMELPDLNLEINLELLKLNTTNADLEWIKEKIKRHIENNIKTIGPYIHENKFICFVWDIVGRSMEYEGGMTVELQEESIEHEIFHSWFARGIKPATQNDSWIDEAWTKYSTSKEYIIKPFSMSDNPVTLSSANPFNRITPNTAGADAYKEGSRFFATLSSIIGSDNLKGIMSSFYKEKVDKLNTTKELEEYLELKSGKDLTKYFKRFVYGLA